MMVKESNVFDWLAHIMIVWGVSMLMLCLFCIFFGEEAVGYSSIFVLGSRGISVATAMQFLLISVLITLLRWIFFTDVIIKRLGILWRTTGMFAATIAAVILFTIYFQWFPVDQTLPWIMFFLSFAVCTAVSVIVSVKKERADNRKMQEALERMKGERE